MSPQEAYNILFKNGYRDFLKSAIDIGDRYIFVFEPLTSKKNAPPLVTGPFRTSLNKKNGEIGLFNMLTERMTQQVDVTKDIKTVYDKKWR